MIVCQLQPIRMIVVRLEILKREMHKEPPQAFTLKFFNELLLKKYMREEIEKEEHVDTFRRIMGIINLHIDADEDISELLYELMDVDLITKNNAKEGVFPSKELLKGLIRLNISGKLESLLDSPKELKKELLSGPDVTIEVSPERKKPKLGTFCIKGDKLLCDLYTLEKCVVMGGVMLPPVTKYESIISMDINTGTYYLHHNGDMDATHISRLLNIIDCPCMEMCWVRDGCE